MQFYLLSLTATKNTAADTIKANKWVLLNTLHSFWVQFLQWITNILKIEKKRKIKKLSITADFNFNLFLKTGFHEDNVDQFKEETVFSEKPVSPSDKTLIISKKTQPLNYSSIIIVFIWEVASWLQYQKPLNLIHATDIFLYPLK